MAKLTVIRSFGEMTTYANPNTTKDIFATLAAYVQTRLNKNPGWHIQNIEQSIAENDSVNGAIDFYAYLTVVYAYDGPVAAGNPGSPAWTDN